MPPVSPYVWSSSSTASPFVESIAENMRLLMSKKSETMGTSHRGKVRPGRSEGIALVQRIEGYRKMCVGATAQIGNIILCVEKITSDGERVVMLNEDVDLYSGGSMPLPPYVRRESDTEDAARYQTVFAHTPGALAAPTAGLHFTP